MQKHFFKLLMIFQLITISKIFAQKTSSNITGNTPEMPRMTAAQVSKIHLPETGLIVFNTTVSAFQINTGTAAHPSWQTLGANVGNWLTSYNNSTVSAKKEMENN
jgi:hypothetical protein